MAFVDDLLNTLFDPKVGLGSLPVGRDPRNYPRAVDLNALRVAALELRSHTSGWVNVKTYGAVLNGIANDLPALAAADAAAGGAKTIVVPGPLYVASPVTLSSPVRFEGGGQFLGSAVAFRREGWKDRRVSMSLAEDGPGSYGSAGIYLDKQSAYGGSHVIGFSVDGTPLWETGLDFENEDYVLAYSLTPSGPYPTADLFRIMRDRRMAVGPEVPKLSALDKGFFNLFIPPTSEGLSGVRIREYLGNAYVGDALTFERYADTDRHWVHWKQGTTTRDWRIGMVQEGGKYNLKAYHADGSPSTPSAPGVAKLTLTQDGGLTVTGPVISGAYVQYVATNGGIIYPDCSLSSQFLIDIPFSSAAAFTIGNPQNATQGQRISIRIRALAAGVTTITWESSYRRAAWTNPASGYSRTIDFIADGTSWIEASRTPADVPN